MTNVFLQKINSEFSFDFVFSVYQYLNWYKKHNIVIVDLDKENFTDLKNIDISKHDIAFGSIEFVHSFFDAVGLRKPDIIDYPTSLNFALKREVYKTTFGDYLKNFKLNVFIKPSVKQKLFDGFVVENHNIINTLKTFYNIDNNTEIFVSELLDFKTEYRIFVFNNKIQGIHFYKGDVELTFSEKEIKEVKTFIEKYKNPPISYSLDVGICIDKNKNRYIAMVEVNDFFSLGSYGLEGSVYFNLTKERFKEIKNYE